MRHRLSISHNNDGMPVSDCCATLADQNALVELNDSIAVTTLQ